LPELDVFPAARSAEEKGPGFVVLGRIEENDRPRLTRGRRTRTGSRLPWAGRHAALSSRSERCPSSSPSLLLLSEQELSSVRAPIVEWVGLLERLQRLSRGLQSG
jgi:hypothetical protein